MGEYKGFTYYELLVTHTKTGIQFIHAGSTSVPIKELPINNYSDITYTIQVKTENLSYEEYFIVGESRFTKEEEFHLPSTWECSALNNCFYCDFEQQMKQSHITLFRDSLLQKQGGVCTVCGRSPKNPVLDHDHAKFTKGTSRIRAVLCSGCNSLLGAIERGGVKYAINKNDLPMCIRGCAKLLEAYQPPFIHPTEAPKKPRLMKTSYNELVKVVNGKQKIPIYPKQGRMTVGLTKLFEKYRVEPKFYKT